MWFLLACAPETDREGGPEAVPAPCVSGVWYADADGDGFGAFEHWVAACAAPDGYGADFSDCDDADPERRPGAVDGCDGVDNDCDGTTDAGCDEAGSLAGWPVRIAGMGGAGIGQAFAISDGGLLVGARQHEDEAGSVWLLQVGRGLTSVSAAEASWTGATGVPEAGTAVAAVDMDGDGVDELAIGAPGDDRVGYDAGAVSFVQPGDELEAAPAWLGTQRGMGQHLAACSDVDGVGTNGLFMSSSFETWLVTRVPGGAEAVTGTPLVASGAVEVGDVDGDGLTDVAFVSEWGYTDYLVLGPVADVGTLDDADAWWHAYPEPPTNLAGAGDVDGDGSDDWIAGGYGAAYVFTAFEPGQYNLASVPIQFEPAASSDDVRVAPIGDADGDGRTGLAVGVAEHSAGYEAEGAVYVIDNVTSGWHALAEWEPYLGGYPYAGLGLNLAGADVTADGSLDLLVAGFGVATQDGYPGVVYVLEM